MKSVQESAERVVANVERVIVGKHVEVRMALVALLCEEAGLGGGRAPGRRGDG